MQVTEAKAEHERNSS